MADNRALVDHLINLIATETESQANTNVRVAAALRALRDYISERNQIYMVIDTKGETELTFGDVVDVACYVFQGFEDITDDVQYWKVTRDTGNPQEDEVWNLLPKAVNFSGNIVLGYDDLGSAESKATFTFRADGVIKKLEVA